MNENKIETLIIIPVYNAELRIKRLLEKLMGYKTKILFIDDGSNDKTYKILKERK